MSNNYKKILKMTPASNTECMCNSMYLVYFYIQEIITMTKVFRITHRSSIELNVCLACEVYCKHHLPTSSQPKN